MGFLDGVTVLSLASVGPAARAASWLADFGARVVRIAAVPRAGEVQVAPPEHAYAAGRGTRRICLDLKSETGRETFLRLAESADVVIESFRPGVVGRLGVDYDAVASRNPGVVYCSTTGYGQSGPRAAWAGHDINYLAMAGYLAATEPGIGGKPPVPGATIADAAAGGMHAVMSILAALVARQSSGHGSHLDVAVTDGVLSLMSLQADGVLATGAEPPPGSAPLHADFACYDTYRAADGGWLAVGAIESGFFANLCRALGVDESLAGLQWDPVEQPRIREALAAAFATRSRDAWTTLLCEADTCVTPVLSLADVLAAERGSGGQRLAVARRSDGSRFEQLAPLLAGSERTREYDVPSPGTTATVDVLGEAGFGEQEIDRLLATGTVA